MDLQHHLRRFFTAHREHSLQDHDDEVHRRVVVVQQHHFVERWRLDLGFFGLEDGTALFLVSHVLERYSGSTWGQCLMNATVFTTGTPLGGQSLDATAEKR